LAVLTTVVSFTELLFFKASRWLVGGEQGKFEFPVPGIQEIMGSPGIDS
jgi:hypothetical protein